MTTKLMTDINKIKTDLVFNVNFADFTYTYIPQNTKINFATTNKHPVTT